MYKYSRRTANIATIIGVINWCLNFTALLLLVAIIIIGIKHRRDLRDISLVLTYNTCFAALLTCLVSAVMTTSNLSNGFLTFNFTFCCVWGLLYDIFQCSIYHSYYLQAFYRLCRVVFYKKKSLVSYSFFIMLIIGQWSFSIIILLPPFFLKWYVRLPTDQYCLVPYTHAMAEMYHILVLQMIPLVFITSTYIWITVFVRYLSRTPSIVLATNQRQRNIRDLTVIKRIVILISILIALRFPSIIFMIYAVVVGQLYPLTFGIVGLITSVCMIFMGIMIVYITPHLLNNLCIFFTFRHNQVNIQRVTQQQIPQNMTDPTVAGRNLEVPPKQNKSSTTRNQNTPV
ncbi:unnamed protein product [Adineta steineri]|uniref:G-protein coupled receptors family 1 profile domain-containing protein n=1 Tax=Adineta steineri TaxID=433720 RepID=A0A819J1T9_9BILA|nr:unnamed protein product [Adineta steineri]